MIKFISHLIDKNVAQHARALTFSTVLSLVPLLTILFGIFAGSEWGYVAINKIQSLLIKNLFPAQISQSFIDYVIIITEQAINIKKMGYVFFIITILFLFIDMEQTFADIDRVNIEKKWFRRIFSLFTLLLVPICLFVVLGVFEWILNYLPEIFSKIVNIVVHYSYVSRFIIFIAVWAWFYFLYAFLPRRVIYYKTLLAGSLITTLCFIAAQQIFSLYLRWFPNYDLVYGAFSAIPVFLLWLYSNWIITLYGFVLMLYFEKPKAALIS